MGNLHRAHVFNTLVLIVSMLGLAGCLGGEETSGNAVDELPDPASLQAPVWKIGDEWHYLNDEGRWRNETVVGTEHYNGYEVYRVEVLYSTRDVFGVGKRILFVDVQSMGFVAYFDEDGVSGTINPPNGQLFPMINRTYEVHVEYSWGAENHTIIKNVVHGWEVVDTPDGPLPTVKITMSVEEFEQTREAEFYSPTIGNYVRSMEGYDDPYSLMSWQKS